MNRIEWEKATSEQREQFGRSIVKRLPAGFTFDGLHRYELGGRAREVARYQHADRVFVYVPGAEVSLGFDASGWQPTSEELASYEGTAEDYGLDSSIHSHLEKVTLRPRTVTVPSMLAEQEPQEVGWARITEAEARARMGDHFPDPPSNITLCAGETTRVAVTEAGVDYYKSSGETHADLVERIKPLRLPTSDEWEYLCGAGTDTLYRWGDHAPCNIYPTDVSPKEAAWRRQWVLSGGELSRPDEGFAPTFTKHHLPNSFGIVVSGNPYRAEVVAEADRRRGGDGGCMICGGAGFWVGWLTLATAYFEPELCGAETDEPIDGDYAVVRRVLSL